MKQFVLTALISVVFAINIAYASESKINNIEDGYHNMVWGTSIEQIKCKKIMTSSERRGDAPTLYGIYKSQSSGCDFDDVKVGNFIYKVNMLTFDKNKRFFEYKLDVKDYDKITTKELFDDLVNIYGQPSTGMPVGDFNKYFKLATWNTSKAKIVFSKFKEITVINDLNSETSRNINYTNNDKNIEIIADADTIRINNASDKYISIKSISLYYGKLQKTKIATINIENTKYNELPPLANIDIPIKNTMSALEWRSYVNELTTKPIKFGVAIKYSIGNNVETLFKLSEL